MYVVVIGLGSMGKRRIRLIQSSYPNFKLLGVDGREDRRKEAEELYSIPTFDSISAVDHAPDCVLVCSSPLSHAGVVNECLKNGWHVFTELNLVEDLYQENMKVAEDNGLVLFMSSTFLYREETRYIKAKVDGGCDWNYVYHVGQYLPDWHQWESYKDFFVGDKRTNGCREILAIELPWLVSAFGEVVDHHAIAGNMSSLKVDYCDNFMIHLVHENGNRGSLVVDVVSPHAVRQFEAYSEGRYLSWHGTPESLCQYDSNSGQLVPVLMSEETVREEGYSSFIVENAYTNEVKAFFDAVQYGERPSYGYKEDLKTLRLIDSLGA